MRHLSENRHALGPDFDVRFNVQKSVAGGWFSAEPTGTKKEAKASFFNADNKIARKKNATQ
ncbi:MULTISPECIES: hypothetical protein [Pseudomonas]|uniref:hypothetical protein n=1 Tax=Pseudomonas TaxID=286 RepID=UPI001304B907|nr:MULTISPECIES: hypothetical protein [Pseudomonas]